MIETKAPTSSTIDRQTGLVAQSPFGFELQAIGLFQLEFETGIKILSLLPLHMD